MDATIPIVGEEQRPEPQRTERRKIHQRQALSAGPVAETLLEGQAELDRSSQALAWCALAAGIPIGPFHGLPPTA